MKPSKAIEFTIISLRPRVRTFDEYRGVLEIITRVTNRYHQAIFFSHERRILSGTNKNILITPPKDRLNQNSGNITPLIVSEVQICPKHLLSKLKYANKKAIDRNSKIIKTSFFFLR